MIEKMLQSIILNNQKIDNEIINAFSYCDRAFFVDPALTKKLLAEKYPQKYEIEQIEQLNDDIIIYSDNALPIGYDQTISQPSTIARMLILLQLQKGYNVLEVGTGSGYHACLTAYLISPGKLTTIEIFPELVEQAKKNIKQLQENLKEKELNLEVICGNVFDENTKIWQDFYDRIYFTAGASQKDFGKIEKMIEKLLKENGIALFPTNLIGYSGPLYLYIKTKEKILKYITEEIYSFVPLLEK